MQGQRWGRQGFLWGYQGHSWGKVRANVGIYGQPVFDVILANCFCNKFASSANLYRISHFRKQCKPIKVFLFASSQAMQTYISFAFSAHLQIAEITC